MGQKKFVKILQVLSRFWQRICRKVLNSY